MSKIFMYEHEYFYEYGHAYEHGFKHGCNHEHAYACLNNFIIAANAGTDDKAFNYAA
ncbi:MAG: hypothetical protein II625_08145 [Bacilli bacterium]|nr:hypothetical protein [Bacilli bacterium]